MISRFLRLFENDQLHSVKFKSTWHIRGSISRSFDLIFVDCTSFLVAVSFFCVGFAQLAAILSRLGRLGKMHDLVTVGDNGKMVLALQQSLRMKGKVSDVEL